MTDQNLTVSEVRTETPGIRSLVLAACQGGSLAPFTPGAHLKVRIPGLPEPRCYSLVCLEPDESLFSAPGQYRLGVRLEDPGAGGSRYMHQIKAGDTLQVQGPVNDFPIHAPVAGEPALVLVAGGIGITPIASMAALLKAQGRAFVLHYYGRSPVQMSFLQTLRQQHGQALQVHADDDPSAALTPAALVGQLPASAHLYVCGPKGLIDAVLEQADQRQWPREQIHIELFTTAAPQSGDRGFELELRQSGRTLHVPSDKTILEVLIEAGCDPMYDCSRGECGVCQATVLEGVPDHRDYYLSDAEKKAGNVMQICVSRSHSDRLVLDL